MKTTEVRVVAAAVVLLAASCGKSAAERPAAPAGAPNIILFIVDTLRADHIGAYGYRRDTTPTLNRLASQGIRFDAAIAHSSWSAPSHTSIITGTLPYRHSVAKWGDAIPEEIEPLTVHLKRLGYRTGLFSTHRVLHESVEGIQNGADESFVGNMHQDEEVLEEAAEWTCQQERPYFLYMVTMTPHAPYKRFPEEYDEKYFTDMPPGGEKTYPFGEQWWVGPGEIPGSVRLGDHDQLGFYIDKYDRGVRWADELIRRFLDGLGDCGQLDNTLIVVTADHGEGLGDHDTFAHEVYLYDFLVRVPLIMHWPGRIPPAQEWKEQVQLVDLVPTLLGFVGAPPPPYADGIDLSAAILDGSRPHDDRFCLGSYRHRGYERFMVRTDGYKLIFDPKEKVTEFYDLAADPAEEHNLLDQELSGPLHDTYRALLRQMERLVELESMSTPSRQQELTPEMEAELRALGYMESKPAHPPTKPKPR